MKQGNPNVIQTCYGCKQFYPSWPPGGRPGDPYPVVHCGGEPSECSYYLGIGQPDVGCYAKEDMQNEDK